MKTKTTLLGMELLFTVGILLFVLWNYVSGEPVPKDVFLAFVFYPLAILGTVVIFSYYISIKFGKSIVTYGIVLGLGISLGIFAVRVIPPLLTLGIVLYLYNRLLAISEIKDLRQISASMLADHLVSFQVASLIVLAITREYWPIFEKATVSPVLLLVIIVWYLLTIFYEAKALAIAFKKWSRSE